MCGGDLGGGGAPIPKVRVSTVELAPKAVALTHSGRRALILNTIVFCSNGTSLKES